jgi:hypothetical protein
MAVILDALTLQMADDLPDAADMIDRVQNEISAYYVRTNLMPRYLYMNDRVWAICATGLIEWTDGIGIEVIDSPFMPPDIAFLNYNRYPHRDIAKFFGDMDRDDAIADGRLEIL